MGYASGRRGGDHGVVHPTQTTWSVEEEVPQRKSKVVLRKDNVGQGKTQLLTAIVPFLSGMFPYNIIF